MADLALRPNGRRVIPVVIVLAPSVGGPAASIATGIPAAPVAGSLSDAPPLLVAGVPRSMVATESVRCGGVPA